VSFRSNEQARLGVNNASARLWQACYDEVGAPPGQATDLSNSEYAGLIPEIRTAQKLIKAAKSRGDKATADIIHNKLRGTMLKYLEHFKLYDVNEPPAPAEDLEAIRRTEAQLKEVQEAQYQQELRRFLAG
jgi:hypothetical protein